LAAAAELFGGDVRLTVYKVSHGGTEARRTGEVVHPARELAFEGMKESKKGRRKERREERERERESLPMPPLPPPPPPPPPPPLPLPLLLLLPLPPPRPARHDCKT
jgi:hypothetical protein